MGQLAHERHTQNKLNKASRIRSSKFFDPNDENNWVTFRNRCKLISLLFNKEADLRRQFNHNVLPLFFGIYSDAHAEEDLTPIFDALHKSSFQKHTSNTLSNALDYMIFAGRSELADDDGIRINVKLALSETVAALLAVYEQTCLHCFGKWTLEFLVRFAIYCNETPADGHFNTSLIAIDRTISLPITQSRANIHQRRLRKDDFNTIIEMEVPHSSMMLEEHHRVREQPSYSLRSLPWIDYLQLLHEVSDKEQRKSNYFPAAFFHEGSSTYLTTNFPLLNSSIEDLKKHLEEVHRETRTHYLQRVKTWAQQQGFQLFEGYRETSTLPDFETRLIAIYYYYVHKLSDKEIAENIKAYRKKENLKPIYEHDIENIIHRTSLDLQLDLDLQKDK